MRHAVQFYESPDSLLTAVATFAAGGLDDKEPVIIIATPAHRDGFTVRLSENGIDVDAAQQSGDLIFADAREMLDGFMRGEQIDRERFVAGVGGLLRRAERGGATVHAFGEMVDLLWRDGNAVGALRLEELWNELVAVRPMSLLCAYDKNNVVGAMDAICRVHSDVLPEPESGETARLRDRLRAIERELKRTNDDNDFLLDATTVWNRSLDYDERLDDVMLLTVPRLADSCELNVLTPDGAIEVRSSAHMPDSESLRAAVLETFRTHEPLMVSLDRGRSALVVPIPFADRVLATLTLVRDGAIAHDHALAIEYARRAGLAIENARLHRLAQESNRTKDQFLATLSHELRTPLTAILGWAHMLQYGNLDPEIVRSACATIERSARTQAALIDDLLDLSKIVTGKLMLDCKRTDLGDAADRAIETLALAAAAKEIVVDVTRGDDALVVGDATRLQQIAWNLVSNAIKFSERGGRVSVRVDANDGQARLVVRDAGSGISSAFLPHVFDPFRQADGTVSREHSGLGLGLAIVKHLVAVHGGTVTAASDGEGAGATFTVTLPRRA